VTSNGHGHVVNYNKAEISFDLCGLPVNYLSRSRLESIILKWIELSVLNPLSNKITFSRLMCIKVFELN